MAILCDAVNTCLPTHLVMSNSSLQHLQSSISSGSHPPWYTGSCARGLLCSFGVSLEQVSSESLNFNCRDLWHEQAIVSCWKWLQTQLLMFHRPQNYSRTSQEYDFLGKEAAIQNRLLKWLEFIIEKAKNSDINSLIHAPFTTFWKHEPLWIEWSGKDLIRSVKVG